LPEGFEAQPLHWIDPKPLESLEQYALRLASAIDATKPFILLGLSMGGMMAAELAKHKKPLCTILISSVPVSKQLPLYYRVLGALQLHRIVPVSLFQHASLLKRVFTFESKEDKNLLRAMVRRSDRKLIHWSMGAILRWRNTIPPSPLIHIHGSRDELIPLRYVRPTHVIPGGTHLMVLMKAREINAILEQELRKFR
jgi:pimeloyl-ACP methyl ester carboxylesterase